MEGETGIIGMSERLFMVIASLLEILKCYQACEV
jgi:hypothetical protein